MATFVSFRRTESYAIVIHSDLRSRLVPNGFVSIESILSAKNPAHYTLRPTPEQLAKFLRPDSAKTLNRVNDSRRFRASYPDKKALDRWTNLDMKTGAHDHHY